MVFDLENVLPEYLEEIFKHLCFQDRRQARYTCKRWNQILSSQTRFVKDERFVFFDSKRQAFAWDVKRKFLTVRIVVDWLHRDSLECLKNVGKYVETLELGRFRHVNVDRIQPKDVYDCFPNLKTVVFPYIPHVSWLESLQGVENFQKVHLLEIDQFCDPDVIRALQKLPKVTAEVAVLGVNHRGLKGKLFPFPSELMMKRFVKNQELHKDFNLVGSRPLGPQDLEYLCYSFNHEPEDLLSYPNLRWLFFEKKSATCFFQHEPVMCKSVKKVSISFEVGCFKCLRSLAASCPNARTWEFLEINKTLITEMAQMGDLLVNIESINQTTNQTFNESNMDIKKLFNIVGELEGYEGFGEYLRKLRCLQGRLSAGTWFLPLSHLTELDVSGYGYGGDDLLQAYTNLNDLVSLAPSIKSFTTSYNISPDDLKVMASRWPHLTFLKANKLDRLVDEFQPEKEMEKVREFFRRCKNLTHFHVRVPGKQIKWMLSGEVLGLCPTLRSSPSLKIPTPSYPTYPSAAQEAEIRNLRAMLAYVRGVELNE